MKTNATPEQLKEALWDVNIKKGYELEFNRFDVGKKYTFFTLKTKSGIPGSRISPTGRRLPSASWHAHGYFFDDLFEINPNAIVWSRGVKITKDEGNWKDQPIGMGFKFSETSIL